MDLKKPMSYSIDIDFKITSFHKVRMRTPLTVYYAIAVAAKEFANATKFESLLLYHFRLR